MTRSQRPPRGLVTLVLSLACCPPSYAQDDEPFDRTPQDCLALTAIDRTRVLDDQTILFYMRGDRVFRNFLPRECPGLERENRFMYETRSSRLCSIDTITVLEQWGARFQPGFTCRLGDFHPISPEEIEDLEALSESGEDEAGSDAIETRAVELPPDEAPPEAVAPTPGDVTEE